MMKTKKAMNLKTRLTKLYKEYNKLENKLETLKYDIRALEAKVRHEITVKSYTNHYTLVKGNGKNAKLLRDRRNGMLTLIYKGKERGTYFNLNDARSAFGIMA